MGGVFQNRDNFIIPDAIFQEYNYTMDSFLDGSPGKLCLLVYPQIKEECINCHLDFETGRSSDTYKVGGPQQFTNFTICPWCNGEGYKSTSPTESIRLRAYYNPKEWVNTGITFQIPDGIVQVIGYMTDLSKLKKAVEIIINKDLQGHETWKYRKESEAIPWGFTSRYFIQFLRRIG